MPPVARLAPGCRGHALRRLPMPGGPGAVAVSEDATYPRLSDGPPSLLFCLAPEGVFRAVRLAAERGGLLPHLFTLALLQSFRSVGRRFVFCDTVRRQGLNPGARACLAARTASCPLVSGLSSPNFCGPR